PHKGITNGRRQGCSYISWRAEADRAHVSRSRSASGSSRSPRGNNGGDADRARSMSRSSYSSRSRSRRGDSRGRSNSRPGGRRGRSRSRSYRGHRRSADPRRNEEEIVRLRDGSIGRTPSPS
ncbi:hypothetical protein FOZ62_011882, partial [Perkinsus olseni]